MESSITHCINGDIVDADTGWMPIGDATKVSFFFARSAHAAGNTVFSVDIAPEKDGTGADDYAKLVSNATNTNSQMVTRVASVTLNSDSVSFVSMSMEDIGGYVRVYSDVTTDGTSDAWIVVCRD